MTWAWPDADDLGRTDLLAAIALAVAVALALAACVSAVRGLPPALTRLGPWLAALALGLAGWELITAKLDLLPRPFFAAPQSMIEVLTDDWRRWARACCARYGCWCRPIWSAP